MNDTQKSIVDACYEQIKDSIDEFLLSHSDVPERAFTELEIAIQTEPVSFLVNFIAAHYPLEIEEKDKNNPEIKNKTNQRDFLLLLNNLLHNNTSKHEFMQFSADPRFFSLPLGESKEDHEKKIHQAVVDELNLKVSLHINEVKSTLLSQTPTPLRKNSL